VVQVCSCINFSEKDLPMYSLIWDYVLLEALFNLVVVIFIGFACLLAFILCFVLVLDYYGIWASISIFKAH